MVGRDVRPTGSQAKLGNEKKGGIVATFFGLFLFAFGPFTNSVRLGNCVWSLAGKKFASTRNKCLEEDTKCCFVILSEAKDLVFLRFFGRFASSE
jgi:hypothetical protein